MLQFGPRQFYHRTVVDLAASADGKWLVSADKWEGGVCLWDLGADIRRAKWQSKAVSAAFSPDGRILLVGCEDGALRLWSIPEAKLLATWKGHPGPVGRVVFSPDGKTALSSGGDKATIKHWEVASGKDLASWIKDGYGPIPVAFSPDGKFAVAGGTGTVTRRELSSGKESILCDLDKDEIKVVAFSPDGKRILLAGARERSGTLTLRDAASGKILAEPQISGPVISAGFSHDGSLVAYHEGSVGLVDVGSGEKLADFLSSEVGQALVFSADGRSVFVAHPDSTIGHHPITDRKWADPKPWYEGGIQPVCLSADGRTALSASGSSLVLWEVDGGKARATWPRGDYASRALSLAWSGDTAVLSDDGQHRIEVWDTAGGRKKKSWEFEWVRGADLALLDEGKSVLVVGGMTVVFDAGTGKQVVELEGEGRDQDFLCFAIAPDGRSLVSGGVDNTVKLFDLPSGKPRATLREAQVGLVRAVACSPDGRLILASVDEELEVFEVEGRKSLGRLKGHTKDVSSVAFSSDGKIAFSSSAIEECIRLWEVGTGKEIDSIMTPRGACSLAVRGDRLFAINLDGSVSAYRLK